MAAMQETDKVLLVNHEIINRAVKGEQIYLGTIDRGIGLLFGNFAHQLRNVCDPRQPRVLAFRTEPVFGLQRRVIDDGRITRPITPLAYITDITELGEPLATRVLERIKAAKAWGKI